MVTRSATRPDRTKTTAIHTAPAAPGLGTRLAWPIAALALVAAVAGLAPWHWLETGPASFVSVRGQDVELLGRGLYRFDSLLAGAGHRGTDAITLLLALPALILSARAHGRGSLRGGLLYLGSLTWFVYAYGSFALGVAAYNEMFLVYTALLSLGFFAFVATFREMESALELRRGWQVRGLAAFMAISAVATFAIWMLDPLTALLGGTQPVALAGYTTLFTYSLDIAVIAPAAGLAAIGLLRRRAWAYLTTASLLTLEALVAPLIAAQTISQLAAGVRFTLVEALAPIGGFGALSLAAAWFLYRLVSTAPGERSAGP